MFVAQQLEKDRDILLKREFEKPSAPIDWIRGFLSIPAFESKSFGFVA
jgi:hypothetical protein